jgi:uncharacterized protein (DUF952 family)
VSAAEGAGDARTATLFHLAVGDEWSANATEQYVPAAFADESFIHLSYRDQLTGVYERYYAGRTDLVVLEIDRSRLLAGVGTDVLREESSPTTGEAFPHLYAPLPRHAVQRVHDIGWLTR